MDDQEEHQECRQSAPTQDQPGPAELAFTVSSLYQALTAAPASLPVFVILRNMLFHSGIICIEVLVGREFVSLISVGRPRLRTPPGRDSSSRRRLVF
jgi:hypothetical protein